MATGHKKAPRRADSSGVSFVSAHAFSGAEGVVVLNTVTNDDSARRRADDLDAEAAYYRHRAIQEEQALGPGYYVDLLLSMATNQAAMAQRIRTGRERHDGRPRDPAGRRLPQPASPRP